MKKHELKIQPQYFKNVINGIKTFEIRKDDRGFEVGDILELREVNGTVYTGKSVDMEITYIFKGGSFGLEAGYCILAINPYFNMKKTLVNILENYSTKQLADKFDRYFKDMGKRKFNVRRKDNKDTYFTVGEGHAWYRVTCAYTKGEHNYIDENIRIAMRKEDGYYLLILIEGQRVFEMDKDGIGVFNEELLLKYKDLFETFK